MKSILFLLLSTVSANALECAPIKNYLDREACYDADEATTYLRQTPTIASPIVSEWNIRKKTSEFKDTTDVYATLLSEEPVRCRSYGEPQNVELNLRCLENTTAIILITTDCHLASGHGGYGDVDYRIDKTPSRTTGFHASTDNRALGLWGGRSAIPFIKRMLGGERMIVRFTPFSESSVTASFNISGIDEAIIPLRKECGW